jgi:hypothetical protein
MATFRFTSAKRRASARLALSISVLLLGGLSPLAAGTLITLDNGNQIKGKLTVTGTTIHAEAESSPADTALGDVLEAKFGDEPFALDFISVGQAGQLPPNWTAQDIGQVASAGSVSVKDGSFALTFATSLKQKKVDYHFDHFFYVSTPWVHDGQFTAHLASLGPQTFNEWGGILLRGSLDPSAPMVGAVLNAQGEIRLPFRRDAGREPWGDTTTGEVPLWLRLTRRGEVVYTAMSTDGTEWSTIAESRFKALTNVLVGLVGSGGTEKSAGTAVVDNVSITPLPSSAEVLPPGLVLQGGSLLVGTINHFSFDPTSSETSGDLIRNGKPVPINRSLIAAVITLPIERSKLEENAAKTGVLMKNGDIMDGDVTGIGFDQITVSSVVLGISTYRTAEARACFLRPIQPQRAAYEVRLRDGSILNATAITGDASEIIITDVSGLTLQADQADVAQIRAGGSLVQELAPLPWKAGASGATSAPNPAATPPLVQSWLGPDQEQVLEAAPGTSIEFPLTGKFRAFGTGVAIAGDSPPDATVTLRILADGHELAKTPPFHAGQQGYIQLNIPSAAHLTLEANSIFPGTRMLYLDPVAIRN